MGTSDSSEQLLGQHSSHLTAKGVMKKDALVTGVSGYIGQKMAEYFSLRDLSMIGIYHTRLPQTYKNMLPLCSDLKAPTTLVPPLKTVDTVVHLAWSGGMVGTRPTATTQTYQSQPTSENWLMTKNLIQAMELARVKKIIYLSWLGVHKNATAPMLRDKYQCERLILNSNIPEKIIIRTGPILVGTSISTFEQSMERLFKFPLVLPLPKKFDDVTITTFLDVMKLVEKNLFDSNTTFKNRGQSQILNLSSSMPSPPADLLKILDSKIMGHKKLPITGALGQLLFDVIDRRFASNKAVEPQMASFFEAANRPQVSDCPGVPSTNLGTILGSQAALRDIMDQSLVALSRKPAPLQNP